MQLMLDLETLSTKTRAVVLSIGMVAFNKDGVEAGRVIHPHVHAQLHRRRLVDYSTIGWCVSQTPEAFNRTWIPDTARSGFDSVAFKFRKYWDQFKCVEVWGNGATFDVSILESLFQDFNIEVPWNFRNVRDLRTLAALKPGVPRPESAIAHSALHDAEAQAKWAQRMFYGE